ncbi:MAG: hypothetical protein ACXVCP_16340 [Bdellovibrio sp.]
MKKKLMAFLILSVANVAVANVSCFQEINQKLWIVPLPYIKTFPYSLATGEGASEAQAKYNLAINRNKLMVECHKDIQENSQHPGSCKAGKIECQQWED